MFTTAPQCHSYEAGDKQDQPESGNVFHARDYGMTDEYIISAEARALAGEIRAVDRKLDELGGRVSSQRKTDDERFANIERRLQLLESVQRAVEDLRTQLNVQHEVAGRAHKQLADSLAELDAKLEPVIMALSYGRKTWRVAQLLVTLGAAAVHKVTLMLAGSIFLFLVARWLLGIGPLPNLFLP